MKTRFISKISSDDWWFAENCKEKGVKSRYEHFVYKEHLKCGATYLTNDLNKNRRGLKGGGSTTKGKRRGRRDSPNIKFNPPRYDIENLFKFNYNDMLNCKPDTKFNKVKSLVFNHEYYNDEQNEEYQTFIEMYNNLSNKELNFINDVYQRLSTYIKLNDIDNTIFVDGSIICNIALMISKYLKTGEIDTSMNYFNQMSNNDCNLSIENKFHLFLIRQCFTTKNHYYKQYISDCFIKDWWAICHIRRRHSDRDMRSKGQCSIFRDEQGKILYKDY